LCIYKVRKEGASQKQSVKSFQKIADTEIFHRNFAG
jgi:hypothetical protein